MILLYIWVLNKVYHFLLLIWMRSLEDWLIDWLIEFFREKSDPEGVAQFEIWNFVTKEPTSGEHSNKIWILSIKCRYYNLWEMKEKKEEEKHWRRQQPFRGGSMTTVGCEMRRWMLNAECRRLNAECWMQNAECNAYMHHYWFQQ